MAWFKFIRSSSTTARTLPNMPRISFSIFRLISFDSSSSLSEIDVMFNAAELVINGT